MRHSLPRAPQFYVTAAQPCPYLNNKTERKLFTALTGPDSQLLNQALSQQGFRRSQNVLYRPSCADCSACLSARIPARLFKASRSQKRTRAKNSDLIREVNSPLASETQFELFKKYLNSRHSTGGMAGMDLNEFSSMIEETSVKTLVCEYWLENPNEGKILVAVCLTDILDDGLSMVYSFFDPKFDKRSLGRYMILDHVILTQQMNLAYVYLGYWVNGSKKMSYKSEYHPLEVFKNGGWNVLDSEKIKINGKSDMHKQDDPIIKNNKPIYLPESK